VLEILSAVKVEPNVRIKNSAKVVIPKKLNGIVITAQKFEDCGYCGTQSELPLILWRASGPWEGMMLIDRRYTRGWTHSSGRLGSKQCVLLL
jgi:hypothetical protein